VGYIVAPKVDDLVQGDVSSSIIRREYLKCVRKVHPDKQKHVVHGDIEGKRQFLIAQKLFAALTDSYRLWTDDEES
jgi:DnaJ-class molecular chaperone